MTNPLRFTIICLNHLKKCLNSWKIKPVALAFILSYFMEKNLRRNLPGIKVYLHKSNKRIKNSLKDCKNSILLGFFYVSIFAFLNNCHLISSPLIDKPINLHRDFKNVRTVLSQSQSYLVATHLKMLGLSAILFIFFATNKI